MKQILKYILSIIIDNLKFSESKHSISLTLSSAVIVFASTQLSRMSLISNIFGVLAIVFCAVSVLSSIIALTAREASVKSGSKNKSTTQNLIYYNTACHLSESDYIKAIIKNYDLPKNYKPDGFDIDLARQIIATSKIANNKFKLFNLSIFFLALGLCFVVASVVVSQVI